MASVESVVSKRLYFKLEPGLIAKETNTICRKLRALHQDSKKGFDKAGKHWQDPIPVSGSRIREQNLWKTLF